MPTLLAILLALQDYEGAWREGGEFLQKREYDSAIQRLESVEEARQDVADLKRVRDMVRAHQDAPDLLKAYRKDPAYDPYVEFLFQLFEGMGAAAKGYKDLRPVYQARVEALKQREKEAADLLGQANKLFSAGDVRKARKLYAELEQRFARTAVWTSQEAALRKKKDAPEMEVYVTASDVETVSGWDLVDAPKAAGGKALCGQYSSINNVPTFIEVEFNAAANVSYRLWTHLSFHHIADNRVGVVFPDEAFRPDGTAMPKPGETPLNVQWWPHRQHPPEENGECWGWSDSDTVHGGREVIFQYKTAGLKKIRYGVLESGTMIDQIAISAGKYLRRAPPEAPAAAPPPRR